MPPPKTARTLPSLIELRARFDEQNNIDWSERLEEAGCKIIYGFEDYKVHSKICLITRRERGAVRHITQVGTGNYNEKTAKQYTDVSLITADETHRSRTQARSSTTWRSAIWTDATAACSSRRPA